MGRWEIEDIIDRYWQGKTTLSEENKLREFFKTEEDIPKEWKTCQSMLMYFSSEKESKAPRPTKHLDLKQGSRGKTKWMAAAVVAILLVSGVFYSTGFSIQPTQNEGVVTHSEIENSKDFFLEMKQTVIEGRNNLNLNKRISSLNMR